MGIKQYVKDWMSEKWEQWVKRPIADATEKYENQASEQINKYSNQAKDYSNKAKEAAYKPVDYYRKKEPFYRGLFWIAVGCLIVLWIISGS